MAVSDNTRGILYMAIAMATFTVNDTLMKLATKVVPLSEAIALRGVMSLLALLVLARMMKVPSLRIAPSDRGLLGLRTFAELGGTITFLLALQQMPLANLSAIMQSLPLAVTLGAALIMGEAVGWRRMTAILIGFGGVLLIVRPGTDGFNIWAMLAILSVAFVVMRDLVTRRFSNALPSVTIAIYTSIGVTTMGFAGFALEPWIAVSLREFLLLAGASAGLIAGYLFIVMAMRVGDVAIVAPFRYSALLWAIGFGWLVFGDFPRVLTLIGAAIVVATGLYTYLREHQLHRRLNLSKAALTKGAPPNH
ncbi:DMT family transporter [Pseudorhodobacter sp.]|uniref:DMT family transporter n=1 Tax=Pseudorhodobacter sp. TaxID=1934400 RepID=UPI0026473ACE|nr:DMT family transporter [Pseudorhodobacter sp.]MDN5787400.1 DMT family transporter [Pseudorhodobacter sp.]